MCGLCFGAVGSVDMALIIEDALFKFYMENYKFYLSIALKWSLI